MKHAPLVVIVTWQRSEHGNLSLRYETCSDSCHRDMTTVRAWLFISKVKNMLRQLSSSHDNGQSMVNHPLGMKHAPSVVIASWQRSGHSSSSLRYVTCSVSCHSLMTTVRAWLFISKVWNMLRQLLSSNDNGQSMVIYPIVWTNLDQTLSSSDNGQTMVIYPEGMNHAPTVVFISWQLTEHGNTSLRYEPCSVSWYRLVTTVRTW